MKKEMKAGELDHRHIGRIVSIDFGVAAPEITDRSAGDYWEIEYPDGEIGIVEGPLDFGIFFT